MKEKKIFLVVGRLGKALTISKLEPILESKLFDKIIVFSDEIYTNNKNVDFVTIPKILNLIIILKPIRIIYETLQLIYYSIKIKPLWILGIYLLPKGLNSFIAGKISRAKIAVNIIGGQSEIEQRYLRLWKIWKWLNLFVIKYSDLILVKGERDKKFLESQGINKKEIYTYNGGIDINRFLYSKEIIKDIDIIFVGHFYNIKGPDRFIQILKKVKQFYPKVKAKMLGSGPDFDKIKILINKLGLTENIELEGFVNNTENFLMRSKILVMPSTTEGLATAMLEAMACGCVPVISDVGNQKEAAIDGYNAFIVKDYFDIDSFASCCKVLLTEDVKWDKISKNGINTVCEKYSNQAQSKIITEVFS